MADLDFKEDLLDMNKLSADGTCYNNLVSSAVEEANAKEKEDKEANGLIDLTVGSNWMSDCQLLATPNFEGLTNLKTVGDSWMSQCAILTTPNFKNKGTKNKGTKNKGIKKNGDKKRKYPDDITCYVCKLGSNAKELILCDGDGCSKAQHFFCEKIINLTESGIPDGNFFCDDCKLKDKDDEIKRLDNELKRKDDEIKRLEKVSRECQEGKYIIQFMNYI